MHPAQIKAALEMREISMADIADQCGGISRKAVSLVVHGRSRSQRVEKCIAGAVELPLSRLWPQWYGPNDQPIKKRKKYTRFIDYLARYEAMQHSGREAA